MSNAVLIKNAEHIELRSVNNTKGTMDLIVNDYKVRLDRRHAIATAASLTSKEDVVADLIGSHFVFEKSNKGEKEIDILREWRDSRYTGFIHDQEFIDIYSDDNNLLNRANVELNIPEYGAGGNFNISSGFTWSAFEQNLKTNVSMLREICSNGAVMKSRFFEKEVPILNLHSHHLDIAANQMIYTAERMIKQRIEKMGREFALNREVEMVMSHAERRIGTAITNEERERLVKLNNALGYYGDCSKYYTQEAMNNGVYRELESPISRMDLWNITTEMNSHTGQNIDSTKNALDHISTRLLFPKDTGRVISEKASKQTFGNPELAFFGA